MATPRKPTVPTTEAVDHFCARFDDLLNRRAARQAFRHYLIGLLLPREHNKTMTVLAPLVPGSERQQLHHFLHDAPWDVAALNARRLALPKLESIGMRSRYFSSVAGNRWVISFLSPGSGVVVLRSASTRPPYTV